MHKTLVILMIALVAAPPLAGFLGEADTRTRDNGAADGGPATAGDAAADAHPDGEPYMIDHGLFTGIIGCAAVVAPLTPVDVCKRVTDTLGVTDDAHVNRFSLELPAGTTALAVRVEADEGVVAPVKMLQRWIQPFAQIPDLKGVPPMAVVWEFPPETAPDFVHQDITAEFVIGPTGDFGDIPNVAVEHGFKVYITSFHNGMPVPEGFVAGPGA